MPTTDRGWVPRAVHNERRDEVTHQGQLGTRCPEKKQETKAWSVSPLKATVGLGWIEPETDLSRMCRREKVLGQV